MSALRRRLPSKFHYDIIIRFILKKLNTQGFFIKMHMFLSGSVARLPGCAVFKLLFAYSL